MKNTLESHRVFPYVAWGLVVLFAGFTCNMAIAMQKEIAQISESTERIEQALLEANMVQAAE